MSISRSSTIALITLLTALGTTAPAKADTKDGDKKLEIVLPKDPKGVVLTFDPGANGFVRKGEPPYIKIQADGQVFVTNVFNGTKTEGKLTPKELEDLLRFVVGEKDFFNVTAAKIDEGIKEESKSGKIIAVNGAGTSEINVQVNGKKHAVKYRGASAYQKVYNTIKALEQYVAVENRLSELARSVEKKK